MSKEQDRNETPPWAINALREIYEDARTVTQNAIKPTTYDQQEALRLARERLRFFEPEILEPHRQPAQPRQIETIREPDIETRWRKIQHLSFSLVDNLQRMQLLPPEEPDTILKQHIWNQLYAGDQSQRQLEEIKGVHAPHLIALTKLYMTYTDIPVPSASNIHVLTSVNQKSKERRALFKHMIRNLTKKPYAPPLIYISGNGEQATDQRDFPAAHLFIATDMTENTHTRLIKSNLLVIDSKIQGNSQLGFTAERLFTTSNTVCFDLSCNTDTATIDNGIVVGSSFLAEQITVGKNAHISSSIFQAETIKSEREEANTSFQPLKKDELAQKRQEFNNRFGATH